MGEIIITNKGYKEIYLTRYYNTYPVFNLYKDDVGFNSSDNPFSDYCYSNTCSVWQNDKIKILSLPNKGKLFYLTNPGGISPIYANVYIGQMILVRDLIDNKVLKFNAEGSFDNEFTGNYLTVFNIERFCSANSNNIIAEIKLNLIEVRVNIGEAYPVSVPQSCTHTGTGPTDYDVWCLGSIDFSLSDSNKIGSPFGYIRMKIDGGNTEVKINKTNGSPLIINEKLPVSTIFNASLNAAGQNPPEAYPFGLQAYPTPANYIFEYSLNGIDDWIEFGLGVTG